MTTPHDAPATPPAEGFDPAREDAEEAAARDRVRREDPWARRLAAYVGERFPPLRHGILIAAYYSSNQFLARALAEPGRPMHYDLSTLLGALCLFLFFFHLRVFDEHKDHDEDLRNYPRRVLSRGVVTLAELRVLGAVAIVAEAALAAWGGRGAFVGWAAAFLFSVWMLREFFVGAWLRRHLVVYATTHMLLMPLLSAMVFSFATGRAPWQAPGTFWLYAFVGFFVSFNWEVSRKLRAPEDEIPGVDTYSSVLGRARAADLVLGMRIVDTALVALVGARLGLAPWFYAALVVLFALPLAAFVEYRVRPTRRAAKRMEIAAGMYIIAFDLVLAAAIATRFGFRA